MNAQHTAKAKRAATVWRWMYNWSFATLCVINPLDSYYSLHNGFHLSRGTLGKLAAWRLAQRFLLLRGEKISVNSFFYLTRKKRRKAHSFMSPFNVCCICILTLRNVNSVALIIGTDTVFDLPCMHCVSPCNPHILSPHERCIVCRCPDEIYLSLSIIFTPFLKMVIEQKKKKSSESLELKYLIMHFTH